MFCKPQVFISDRIHTLSREFGSIIHLDDSGVSHTRDVRDYFGARILYSSPGLHTTNILHIIRGETYVVAMNPIEHFDKIGFYERRISPWYFWNSFCKEFILHKSPSCCHFIGQGPVGDVKSLMILWVYFFVVILVDALFPCIDILVIVSVFVRFRNWHSGIIYDTGKLCRVQLSAKERVCEKVPRIGRVTVSCCSWGRCVDMVANRSPLPNTCLEQCTIGCGTLER